MTKAIRIVLLLAVTSCAGAARDPGRGAVVAAPASDNVSWEMVVSDPGSPDDEADCTLAAPAAARPALVPSSCRD